MSLVTSNSVMGPRNVNAPARRATVPDDHTPDDPFALAGRSSQKASILLRSPPSSMASVVWDFWKNSVHDVKPPVACAGRRPMAKARYLTGTSMSHDLRAFENGKEGWWASRTRIKRWPWRQGGATSTDMIRRQALFGQAGASCGSCHKKGLLSF